MSRHLLVEAKRKRVCHMEKNNKSEEAVAMVKEENRKRGISWYENARKLHRELNSSVRHLGDNMSGNRQAEENEQKRLCYRTLRIQNRDLV